MRSRAIALGTAGLLAACSPASQPANSPAEVPASKAEAAASNGAAPASQRTPTPPVARTPVIPPPGKPAAPAPDASPPTSSLPEGPFAPDSGQAAANVVQTYFALIEAGRFGAARKLWGEGAGEADLPSAADFAGFRDYHANVGGPGVIEGAAGSRFVTVPVRVHGTLKVGGRPFEQTGDVTLRRVGEVDGATPAQKRWHIARIELTPDQPRR